MVQLEHWTSISLLVFLNIGVLNIGVPGFCITSVLDFMSLKKSSVQKFWSNMGHFVSYRKLTKFYIPFIIGYRMIKDFRSGLATLNFRYCRVYNVHLLRCAGVQEYDLPKAGAGSGRPPHGVCDPWLYAADSAHLLAALWPHRY